MTALSPLFHWSPAGRFDSIRRNGLVAGSPAVTCSAPILRVCASPNPQRAWGLSAAMDWTSEHDLWDLWMVNVADGDAIHVKSVYGPVVEEVQIAGDIPAERLWYVGRRDRDGRPRCGGDGR